MGHESFSKASLLAAEKTYFRVEMCDRPVEIKGFSVDPTGTREIDQTMWCERTTEGGYIVSIALSDPSSFVDKSSRLRSSAEYRGMTSYLGGEIRTIFPEVLATDGFSLLPGKSRPCVIVELAFDSDRKFSSVTIEQGKVKNLLALTYDQAEEKLGCDDSPVGKQLRDMFDIAAEIRNQDETHRVVDMDRGLVLVNDRLILTDEQEMKSSNLIVSELMKFANRKIAEICRDYKIEIMYWTKNGYRHGIDHDLAAKFSAPIRRYSDFFSHDRFLNFLNMTLDRGRSKKVRGLMNHLTGVRFRERGSEQKVRDEKLMKAHQERQQGSIRWKGHRKFEELVSNDSDTIRAKVIEKLTTGSLSSAEMFAILIGLERNPEGWEDVLPLIEQWLNKHPGPRDKFDKMGLWRLE